MRMVEPEWFAYRLMLPLRGEVHRMDFVACWLARKVSARVFAETQYRRRNYLQSFLPRRITVAVGLLPRR
jgi:hypothetical protein